MSNETKAISAVLNGPEKKHLKVRGHHWNFKKAKRENLKKTAGTGVVKGRISHAVRFAPDDQVDYEITFQGRSGNGKLVKPLIEIKIKQAPWKKIAAKLAGTVVTLVSENATAGMTTDAVATEIFKHVHGNWEDVAHGLVALIAAEFGKLLEPQRRVTNLAIARNVRPRRLQAHT